MAASHEDVGVEYIVTQEKFHDSKQVGQLKRAHVDVVRAVVQLRLANKTGQFI